MSENQTSARRKFLQTLSIGSLTVLAGCSSSNSSNSDDTTDDGDNTTDASGSNTEAQNSVFSDYYTEGNEFVVELNPNNVDSIEEIILHYNEFYPENEHPRQSVQGISTARFSLEVSGKNDPQVGTWEIEAVGSGETIETAEYEAKRSLSLNKVGTVAQSDKFEHTDGLGVGDLQYSITNDGDIPTTPYSTKLTSSFNSKIASQNVLGFDVQNPDTEIMPNETLEFRRAGDLCFDPQEGGNAQEWVDQNAEAALVVEAGTVSKSWTYSLSVDFGNELEEGLDTECIKGTTVSKRDAE